MAAISHFCQEALFFISGGVTQCAETSSDNPNAELLLNYQSPLVKKKIRPPKDTAAGGAHQPAAFLEVSQDSNHLLIDGRLLFIGSASFSGAELHFSTVLFQGEAGHRCAAFGIVHDDHQALAFRYTTVLPSRYCSSLMYCAVPRALTHGLQGRRSQRVRTPRAKAE